MANKNLDFEVADISKIPADGDGRANDRNLLLLALPRKDREALLAKLQLADLSTHTVLHESGKPMEFAYFLTSGLASILTVLANGKSVEVGLTGADGFVGVALLAGLSSSPSRVVMQVGGTGFKLKAQDLRDAIGANPSLAIALLRYSQKLMLQATQVAACNRLHEVSQRLARWLLMSQDRLGGESVPLTQQYLAHMLGTRRASVTVAAGVLQKAKAITYVRGEVKVENRQKLEAAACECYHMMTRQSKLWEDEAES